MDGQRGRRIGLLLVVILCGPLALMSVYLGFSRWPTRWFTGGSDWVALLLSVGIGLVGIGRLPIPVVARAVLAVLYVPVAGFVLLLYSLCFVGYMFDDWL